jgi:hypothetical protein
MDQSIRASAAALGSRGGRAGSGAAKRRGDSAYYRQLAARRKDRTSTGSGMAHRHLNHRDYTLAAIDDIIGNGRWETWKRLRLAVRADPAIREKVLKVCTARADDASAQRHHFWKQYAQTAAS